MDDFLQQVIGVTNHNARNNIIDAGFEDPNDMIDVDKDWAKQVCSIVRKLRTQAVAGTRVTAICEARMQAYTYWVRLMYITQRQVDDLDAATRLSINYVHGWFKDISKKTQEEDKVEVYSTNLNRRIWFESIEAHLKVKTGERSGVPLLYVIREEAPVGPDPGFFPDGAQQTDISLDLEARGRHDGVFWQSDNAEVWEFLRSKLHGTVSWNLVKPFERRNDGRGAYLRLRQTLMGEDTKRRITEKANHTLQTLKYDGKSRNFTFENFTDKLRAAFNDLTAHYNRPYEEADKVYYLKQAWNVPHLQHLLDTITASPEYRSNFEAAVTFLSQSMDDRKTSSKTREVSSTETNSNPRKRKDNPGKGKGKNNNKNKKAKKGLTKWDPNRPGAWYAASCFKNLTDEQRKLHKEAIAAKRNNNNSNRGTRSNQAISISRTTQVVDYDPDEAPNVPLKPTAVTQYAKAPKNETPQLTPVKVQATQRVKKTPVVQGEEQD